MIKAKLSKRKTAVLVAVLIVILAVLAGIASASLSTGSKAIYNFEGEIEKGIDVSHHNGKINWKEASQEIDFAFVRVGYRGYSDGNISADKYFKRNLKGANKNGVPVGVYFYSQAITPEEAEEEAEFVIKAVKRYDIGLPIFIDYEYAYNREGELDGRLYNSTLSKKEVARIINAFCKKVEQAGYQAGSYASSYFYSSVIETKSLEKSICIWVADYNKEVTYNGSFDIWQYSKTGKCKGVSSKYVDLDYWFIRK